MFMESLVDLYHITPLNQFSHYRMIYISVLKVNNNQKLQFLHYQHKHKILLINKSHCIHLLSLYYYHHIIHLEFTIHLHNLNHKLFSSFSYHENLFDYHNIPFNLSKYHNKNVWCFLYHIIH